MLIKPLSVLAVAAVAGLSSAMIADASPRFTVTNNADKMVKTFVFQGDDSGCHLEEKAKTINSGHSNTMGCSGIALILDRKFRFRCGVGCKKEAGRGGKKENGEVSKEHEISSSLVRLELGEGAPA